MSWLDVWSKLFSGRRWWSHFVHLESFSCSDHLSKIGSTHASNSSFTVAFLYARNNLIDKRQLWYLIKSLLESVLLQQIYWWVINQVLYANDSFFISPPMFSFQGFNDFFIASCQETWLIFLLEVVSTREAIDGQWIPFPGSWIEQSQMNFVSHHSPIILWYLPGVSDHSLCLVSLTELVIRRKSSFKTSGSSILLQLTQITLSS